MKKDQSSKDSSSEETDEPVDDSAEESSESNGPNSEGVKIPEEFQQKVHELIDGCDSEECLNYISSCCNKKQMDMHKEETMDTEGMPDDSQ